MTLQKWAEYGWLKSHATSPQEMADLVAIVDRDIADAKIGSISTDWQFGIAYNAALKLCTILLSAEGYRAGQGLQHYRTIQALPLILGPVRAGDADYLDTCRGRSSGDSILNFGAEGAAFQGSASPKITISFNYPIQRLKSTTDKNKCSASEHSCEVKPGFLASSRDSILNSNW